MECEESGGWDVVKLMQLLSEESLDKSKVRTSFSIVQRRRCVFGT